MQNFVRPLGITELQRYQVPFFQILGISNEIIWQLIFNGILVMILMGVMEAPGRVSKGNLLG
jgi:hypothetical protein